MWRRGYTEVRTRSQPVTDSGLR
ncbi:MAG: hypothetical protein QOF15_214, partial [Mycobacterium sp.]|nr:hypothetical protein [Mycobacterium sp.]